MTRTPRIDPYNTTQEKARCEQCGRQEWADDMDTRWAELCCNCADQRRFIEETDFLMEYLTDEQLWFATGEGEGIDSWHLYW
jgi:hypothetical protein